MYSYDEAFTTNVQSSNSSEMSYDENKVRDFVFIAAVSLMGFVAIIGNIFTVKVIASEKTMRSTVHFLIANNAVSDAIAGFILIIHFYVCSSFLFEQCESGPIICSLSQSVTFMAYNVSSFTLTTIACDRFQGIVMNPYGNKLLIKRPMIKIIVIWLIAFIFNFPIFTTVIIPEYFTDSKVMSIRVLHNYSSNDIVMKIKVLCALVEYILPLIFTAIAYVRVMQVIKNREMSGIRQRMQKQRLEKHKLKTIRLLTALVTFYTIVWFPMHCMTVVQAFSRDSFITVSAFSTIYMFFRWLAGTSICFNPFIYLWYYNEFQQHFNRYWFWCKRQKRRKQHINNAESSERSEAMRTSRDLSSTSSTLATQTNTNE
ncbi:putative G-protein coupled receptor 83-like protein [Leptotrombidium deliense]|uniref:Putative G-protein coupled receptor 83-like protein n=1 Tax=Leptotrombidium deliense TaxID=299467 RepID=A0A443SGC4_9ACAR|nr:putative G-protein coupled receptor 83-like protein [Leptotrombidium deliense]